MPLKAFVGVSVLDEKSIDLELELLGLLKETQEQLQKRIHLFFAYRNLTLRPRSVSCPRL